MSDQAIKQAVLKFMAGAKLTESEAVLVAWAQAGAASRWLPAR